MVDPRRSRIKVGVLAALLIFASSCLGPAELEGKSLDDFSRELGPHIEEAMDDYDIPGVAMAVVEDGRLVWSEAWGYADAEEGRAMTVETVNRAESISKSVTAVGVMTLVEQGLVDLNDPVADHIGDRDFPGADLTAEAITIEQLLSHTAGVSVGSIGVHYPPGGDVPSLYDNLRGELLLVGDPGTSFLYSNTGFNLLEVLVESATGEDFAVYMKREVLGPSGMESATFSWHPDLSVAAGHDLASKPVPVYVYPEKASGGLFASVEDLARFVATGMTGEYYSRDAVLSPESLQRLYTPTAEIGGLYGWVSESYGLGYFVEELSDGNQAVWHGGQGHGWMTDFHLVPETGDGIVIMANSQRSWPMIAGILSDWSTWKGFDPVGFSLIGRLGGPAWVAIVTVSLLALWLLGKVGSALAKGERRIAPLARDGRPLRFLQGLSGLLGISVVAWDIAQDYSFLVSVLPVGAGWLRGAVLGLGLALCTAALTAGSPPGVDAPRADREEEHGPVSSRPHAFTRPGAD